MNELVTPDIGLVFWSTVAFLLLVFVLGKFAWKPILLALHEREKTIEDALLSAENARLEMTKLNQESEMLLKKARAERDEILKEAKDIKTSILEEARDIARSEGNRLIEKAKEEINSQKLIALNEVKNQVARLSIEMAEKVLRKNLENKSQQEATVADMLKDIKLN